MDCITLYIFIYDFKRSNVENVAINGEIEGLENSNDVAKTLDVYKTNVEGVKLIKFDMLYKKGYFSNRTKYYLHLKQC